MLSSPFQNSDFLHRSEVLSEMRNQEALLNKASNQHAADTNRKNEQRKEEEVERTTAVDLDPNANGEGQPKQNKKRNPGGLPNQTEGDSARPRRFLSGGHVDITV